MCRYVFGPARVLGESHYASGLVLQEEQEIEKDRSFVQL